MHLYLIGYRGSGKSTVGRLVSVRLGRPCVDTDDIVEQTSGCTIQQLFEAEGESAFRDRESAAIQSLAAQFDTRPMVVALGGGAILRLENQELLRTTGRCVWLDGPAELLFQRIQADQSTQSRRPNLSSRGGFDEVVDVLSVRRPIYERLSQKTVSIVGRPPDEIATEIADWVIANER